MTSAAVSVDAYLGRTRAPGYDCLAFARDVWADITGEDLRGRLDGLCCAAADRRPELRHLRAFQRLVAPADPCLVLMRRPRAEPHVGVFLRGRVLHLHAAGVEFQPLAIAARAYARVEFFR